MSLVASRTFLRQLPKTSRSTSVLVPRRQFGVDFYSKPWKNRKPADELDGEISDFISKTRREKQIDTGAWANLFRQAARLDDEQKVTRLFDIALEQEAIFDEQVSGPWLAWVETSNYVKEAPKSLFEAQQQVEKALEKNPLPAWSEL
eukprot:TRINITY_DN792_c0_g1_i1.p2 TRINITY_DN792_c0_g1~~TRINITY_DN792_c0_g1_i1.p2  ORF type:complete len:147 (-),score=50.19 TRINITY_DN792_c0_g1_i1:45-485(-)